jgi:hypothetical protein
MQMNDVVELATSEAPPLRTTVDDIVAAGQKYQRRRRLRWSGGAAALAVVAVAGAAVVPQVLNHPAAAQQTATAPVPALVFTQPAQPFTYTLKSYDVGKYHVAAPTDVSTAYERLPVYENGTAAPLTIGEMVVYRTGAFVPSSITGATSVTVGGNPGLYKTGTTTGVGKGKQPVTLQTALLAWQYTDGAWATLSTGGSPTAYPEADLIGIAAGLVPGSPTAARIPLTLSYVPAGYSAVEVATRSDVGDQRAWTPNGNHYGGVYFLKPAPAATGLTGPWNYGEAAPTGGAPLGGFYLVVIPQTESNYQLHPGEPVPAEPRCESLALCHAWSADGKTEIEIVGDGKLSNAELIRVPAWQPRTSAVSSTDRPW